MAITAWNGKSTWKNLQISNCSEELTSDSRERNFVTGCLLWVGSWGCCNACNSFSAILQADLCVFLLEKVHWPQLDSHAWFASSRFWVSFCKSHMLHVWYIYLHLPPKLPSFVGRCSSTMISPWFPWAPRPALMLFMAHSAVLTLCLLGRCCCQGNLGSRWRSMDGSWVSHKTAFCFSQCHFWRRWKHQVFWGDVGGMKHTEAHIAGKASFMQSLLVFHGACL